MRILASLIAFSLALAGCASKAPSAGKAAPPPQTGYVEVGAHTCYAPPIFEGLSATEVRHTRRQGLSEAQAHWRGEVDPALSFADITLAELEDRSLLHPEDLEPTLAENFALCQQWARGEIDAKAYEGKLVSHVRAFDRGRCEPQLYNPYSQNVLVNVDWQGDLKLCAGQVADIKVSEARYTLKAPKAGEPIPDEETQWITPAGDTSVSVEEGPYPCKVEGCFAGMLIGRFAPENGGEPILFPIGTGTVFRAPNHGTVSVQINDSDYQDNRFYEENQVLDFLVLEITTTQ